MKARYVLRKLRRGIYYVQDTVLGYCSDPMGLVQARRYARRMETAAVRQQRWHAATGPTSAAR